MTLVVYAAGDKAGFSSRVARGGDTIVLLPPRYAVSGIGGKNEELVDGIEGREAGDNDDEATFVEAATRALLLHRDSNDDARATSLEAVIDGVAIDDIVGALRSMPRPTELEAVA